MSMQSETTTKDSRIRRFFGMFKDSAKEIKHLQTIVVCGLMAALAIVLSIATSMYIIPTTKIGLSGLPNRIVDYLYGPVVGCIFGGLMDVLKFLIKPDGGFFFGYTLTAMLGGLIYGIFYYHLQIKAKNDLSLKEEGAANRLAHFFIVNAKALLIIFIANTLVKIFCNICLNTLWSSMMTGKAFLAILPARVIKNLLNIPLDTIVHFFLLKVFQQLRRFLLPENTGRRGTDTTDK